MYKEVQILNLAPLKFKMRFTFGLIFLLLGFANPVPPASADGMVFAQDLRAVSKQAKVDNLVLVIEFQSEYCEYCVILEEEFLLPMQRNADYRKKILIRSVSMDSHASIIDFDGRSISTTEFAYRYNVTVTPTLLFLDANGVEISEKIVGIWSEDYYGGFIDQRIDQARSKL